VFASHSHITSIQFLKILRDKYTQNRLKHFLLKQVFYVRASLNKDYIMPHSSKTIATGTFHTKPMKSVRGNYF
jgi:hypothetical protein